MSHRVPLPRVTSRTESEKRIQADDEALLRMAGCRVYHLSQSRATRQTPGLADTFFVVAGWAVWVEWKTPKGRQSPEQQDFQRDCESAGLVYLLGGLDVVRAWLCRVGLARMEGTQFILTPQRRTA